VVSVAVKSGQEVQTARSREANTSKPSMKCRKWIRRCQNRGMTLPLGSARGIPPPLGQRRDGTHPKPASDALSLAMLQSTRTRGSQMDPRRIITETNLKTSHRHAARFDRCRSSSHFCGCYGLRVFDADRVLCRHTVPSLASRKLLILLLCAVVPSSAQYARLVPV
jgi:hypothetical protein